MTRLVWAFGWVGVALWSVTCAVVYFLFDLIGRGLMRSSDSFSRTPETVEGIWKFFSFLHSFSTGAVIFVWAIVSLLILAVPWTLDRIIGRAPRGAMPTPHPGFHGQGRYDGPGGVIDLPPDQYKVGEPQSGAAPRIPPRG